MCIDRRQSTQLCPYLSHGEPARTKILRIDDISAELLKNGEEAVAEYLTDICNDAWQKSEVFQDWIGQNGGDLATEERQSK